MVQVIVGDSAGLQETQNLTEFQKKEMKADLFRNVISLFRASDSKNLKAQYLGEEEVEGIRTNAILISDVSGCKNSSTNKTSLSRDNHDGSGGSRRGIF